MSELNSAGVVVVVVNAASQTEKCRRRRRRRGAWIQFQREHSWSSRDFPKVTLHLLFAPSPSRRNKERRVLPWCRKSYLLESKYHLSFSEPPAVTVFRFVFSRKAGKSASKAKEETFEDFRLFIFAAQTSFLESSKKIGRRRRRKAFFWALCPFM